MERRKILLGSGAALATVLAGCSSTETDEESPDEDDDNGFDDGADDDASDEYDDDGDDDDDDDEESVPGVEGAEDIGSDSMSVVEVENNPDALHVLVETDTTDTEKLHAEVKYVAEDLAHAIVDRDTFKAEVDTIEWVLEHEGSRVFAVYVDVEWVMEYLDDYITKEELAAKIIDTKH